VAKEYRPGEMVPRSGIYTITKNPAHPYVPTTVD
jgi:hypothetical protein